MPVGMLRRAWHMCQHGLPEEWDCKKCMKQSGRSPTPSPSDGPSTVKSECTHWGGVWNSERQAYICPQCDQPFQEATAPPVNAGPYWGNKGGRDA